MAKASDKATATKKFLCMGCGKYFAKRHVKLIEGVAFCGDCKSAGSEFKQRAQLERDSILSQQGYATSDDLKWETAESSGKMISLSKERVEGLRHAIPLEGIEAPLKSRVLSRALDYFFAGAGLVVLDNFVPLTKMAKTVFGDVGLQASQYQYSITIDPTGREILMNNSEALRKVALFCFLVLLLHRVFWSAVARRTPGQSFAGVLYTTPRGKYPGSGSMFLKAIYTTLSEAVFVGPVLDLIAHAVSRPKASVSDGIANVRAVDYERWKTVTASLIDRTMINRMGDSPAVSGGYSDDLSG